MASTNRNKIYSKVYSIVVFRHFNVELLLIAHLCKVSSCSKKPERMSLQSGGNSVKTTVPDL